MGNHARGGPSCVEATQQQYADEDDRVTPTRPNGVEIVVFEMSLTAIGI